MASMSRQATPGAVVRKLAIAVFDTAGLPEASIKRRTMAALMGVNTRVLTI